MLADVAGHGLLEVVDRAEHTALQSLLGQCSKEAFDGVDPGSRGRDEVEHPSWMAFEPGAHLGIFVGRVVVGNGVDQLPAGTARLMALRKRMNS
jgi:hypothetical protein